MYNLVIVEDLEEQVRVVLRMLGRHPRHEELAVTRFRSAAELDAYLATGAHIDILVMDIELGPDEPNGVELVQERFPPGCGTQVIYTTGYIEYCTRVYRTKHLYFLAKPYEEQDFDDALDQALAVLAVEMFRPFNVRSDGKVVSLLPRQISYIESDRRKLRIHMGDRVVETYATIAEISEKLPDVFVQCHKSFLVNMDYIAEFGSGTLLLRTGESVPVSQKRRKDVREEFLTYIRNRL